MKSLALTTDKNLHQLVGIKPVVRISAECFLVTLLRRGIAFFS